MIKASFRIQLFLMVGLLSSSFISQAQRFGKTLKETPGMVSYTYRNSFQKDIAATLDTIKAMGITNIEFSNLFGRTAQEIRALLDQRGMRCTSFGTSYPELTTKTIEVAQNAKALGATFVRVAWIPHEGDFTVEHAKKAVSDFNLAGKVLKESGLTFCYHNHGYEFVPQAKGNLFDYIVANTDPDLVSFEMDVLWTFHPGADPVALLKKYGPRFKLMHVKDLKKGVKGDFTGRTDVNNDVALGTGQIDIAAVVKAGVKAGVKNFYIEDESSSVNKQVPVSLAFLKAL